MSKLIEDAWVIDQQKIAHQTYRLRLQSPQISKLARAGQFMMLQVRDGLDPLLRRPFSFHRIHPEDGTFEILYRVVGQGTWRLSQTPPGAGLNVLGPLGNGFDPQPLAGRQVVIVAGGIGVAPLFELMRRLASSAAPGETENIHLFYGARTASELLPPSAFEELGVTVHWSTDDGTFGYEGYVTRLFQEVAGREGIQPAVIYSCGPLVVQYHMAQWASARNVPAQLSLESLMACGVGACLGCALPAPHPTDSTADHYVHVCKEGPIFAAGSIQWHKIRTHQTHPPIFLYS